MNCKISSLYICVKDMDRAISFYERLFGMPVTEKDEIYSVFEVGSFRFGLFAYEKKGEPHEFGSNCLPSISFESLDLPCQILRCGGNTGIIECFRCHKLTPCKIRV